MHQDSVSQKHYRENFKISDHKYWFWILQIIAFLEDIGFHWTTKQPLSNFEPQKPKKSKSLPPLCNLIKRETTSQVFSSEFGEILNNIFLIEHFGRLFLLKVNFIY